VRVIQEYLTKGEGKVAYLFDMDGVLTKPDRNLSAYEREMMNKYILIMSLRKKTGHFGVAARKLKFDDKTIKAIKEVWFKINPLNERILPTLKTISRKGYTMVVATNNVPDLTYLFLDKYDIRDYFLKVFGPENMNGIRKPEKKYFLEISDQLRVPPQSMILVDDQKENIDGIKKVGGKGILYNSQTSVKI